MKLNDTADPQTARAVRACTREYDETFNRNDAAAIAGLFTQDAVQVAPEGLFNGRQAIRKRYEDLFQQAHPTHHLCKVDQVNAVGQEVWDIGEWSCTLHGPNGSLPVKGYFAAIWVREGDGLKHRLSSYNMAATPA